MTLKINSNYMQTLKTLIYKKSFLLLLLLVQIQLYSQTKVTGENKPKNSKTLNVAAVQMRSSVSLSENTRKIKEALKNCASQGARIAIFPECALTGYFEEVIRKVTSEQIASAEKEIAEECRKADIYAIIGSPYREAGRLYNSATVFSPEGRIMERYHKVQLAETWPDTGDHLSVFRIDDIPCSVIICHDERYPELVRLPVLAGARVIFYISHESGVGSESKINPYRAQIQARAVENNVYVVHSNAPANKDLTGSHGQSRIIGPDGNIIKEASMFGEDVITDQLDISKATGENSKRSITRGPLKEWMEEGIKFVKIIQ